MNAITKGLLAVTLVGSGAVVANGVSAAEATAASAGRHELRGSSPNWLSRASDLGTTPAEAPVHFGVLLGLRDQAGAEAMLRWIADPDSASYGNWLSNDEFIARYAPFHADVAAVQDWLRSQGFRVDETLPSGMYVRASGSAAQVTRVFGAELHNYAYQGKTLRANAAALSLPDATPAAVVRAVTGVLGLDQVSTMKRPASIRPADTLPGPAPGARYGVQPCSNYYGQKSAYDLPSAYGSIEPYVICGYGPQQYQSAYGVSKLLEQGVDGRGVTVAILDAYASPTIYQDAQQYNSVHHQPPFRRYQFTQITPGPDGYDLIDECGAQGWYGEETLDVEAVHAMAPGANIIYVGASDCASGLDDAWAGTIDNHIADVITNSWTDGVDDVADLGAAYIAFYQQFSLEAALTGITVNFSTGDSGDHTAGGTSLAAKSVEFPADLPFVTGVGGTSVLIGRQGQWLGEYGWQNAYSSLSNGAWSAATYSSGGGGGTSQLFEQPFYQVSRVPASISQYYGGSPMRALPDIAIAGDPNTGFEVGQTQVFPDGTYWAQYRIGGTSLSSPLLAGLVAVADQAKHHPLGFINPLYYRMLGTPAVHDIVAPTSPLAEVRTDYVNGVDDTQGKRFRLRTIDVQTSTLHSTVGYDNETGVGSPNGPEFFRALTGWH
ncbi:MAG TPA: S53 family peptidase [Burkholderiaceae bacterium]|nr:S53 family peptidase [Burkholderiaceae bacterium]